MALGMNASEQGGDLAHAQGSESEAETTSLASFPGLVGPMGCLPLKFFSNVKGLRIHRSPWLFVRNALIRT